MDPSTLLSTFGLIFVAELGDKTQLAVMAQTCKYRSPWPVFLGGSLALTAVTAIGALGGSLIGNIIPAGVIRMAAALSFVVMGVLIWREAARATAAESAKSCDCMEAQEGGSASGRWNWKAFSSTLTLLFFAELGDKTQLAVLGLASKQTTPWGVLIGGSLALTAVTALGVVGGQQLCKLIPQQLLLKISAVAFVILGILMGAGIL
ncbi:MAG: TMEM165/GDT1 family protein [Anaerolineae bacterium]|nr:TMEM165/GDT1 family protein [Anaerolineae bacterium]